MNGRASLVVRIFASWTVYVWVTRLWNIWRDRAQDRTVGFKLVHTAIAAISLGLAGASWRAVAAPPPRGAPSP